MGLPPATRDAVMRPILIPKEPELSREVVGNKTYGVEADGTLETVISSILDDDVDKRALIESDSDKSTFSDIYRLVKV